MNSDFIELLGKIVNNKVLWIVMLSCTFLNICLFTQSFMICFVVLVYFYLFIYFYSQYIYLFVYANL